MFSQSPQPRSSTSAPVSRFTFSCVRCGCFLEATVDLSGCSGRCPTCGEILTIPEIDPLTGLAVMMPGAVAHDSPRTPLHAYATAGGRAPHILRRETGEQVILCPRCGRESPTDANACESCRLPFTLDGAAAPVVRTSSSDASLSVIVFLTGLLSLPQSYNIFLGPLAMALGFFVLRRTRRRHQTGITKRLVLAGIILGGISAAWFLIRLPLTSLP